MAKLTALQLVNRILPKISLATISTVTGISGKQLMVLGYINEAQTFLASQADWYSLYTMRRWSTVTYSATTISADGTGDPDTFDDSGSAFVTQGFSSNQTVNVRGFTETANNGHFHIDTVTAGSLTLQSSHVLTTEAEGDSVVIQAITYPVATDHSRTIDLMDQTNNNLLIEDDTLLFDLQDPDGDYTGTPRRFTVQGSAYRLDPIPDGDNVMLERYWKTPDVLSTDAATSDLPLECENLILYYAEAMMADYLREFERSDRLMRTIGSKDRGQLADAIVSNKRQINKMRIMGRRSGMSGGRPDFPQLPDTYDRRFV